MWERSGACHVSQSLSLGKDCRFHLRGLLKIFKGKHLFVNCMHLNTTFQLFTGSTDDNQFSYFQNLGSFLALHVQKNNKDRMERSSLFPQTFESQSENTFI